jgi:hypothetical protein
MAKKDKQKDKHGGAGDAVDAIRSTIERAIEGAGLTEKRQREFVEQVSSAAGRIRQTMDDLRVVDEVREMRAQLEALASRVGQLESGARGRVTGAARRTTAASTSATGATPRPRATSTRSTSTRSTGTRAAGTKSAGTTRKAAGTTGAKSTGTSAAKPARTTRAKSTGTSRAKSTGTTRRSTSSRSTGRGSGSGSSGSSS